MFSVFAGKPSFLVIYFWQYNFSTHQLVLLALRARHVLPDPFHFHSLPASPERTSAPHYLVVSMTQHTRRLDAFGLDPASISGTPSA